MVKSAKDGVLGTIPHRLSHFICVNFSDVSNIDHVSGTGHEMMELSPHRTRHLSVTESAACSRLIGSNAMSYYRAYIVGEDGDFIEALNLDCADDGAAIESAKQIVKAATLSFGRKGAW